MSSLIRFLVAFGIFAFWGFLCWFFVLSKHDPYGFGVVFVFLLMSGIAILFSLVMIIIFLSTGRHFFSIGSWLSFLFSILPFLVQAALVVDNLQGGRHSFKWDEPVTYIIGAVMWLFPLQVALMVFMGRKKSR